MLKHSGGVEGYFDLRHLQHASTYIAFDGMVGEALSLSFSNHFFWIDNQLNIKKIISKKVMCPYSVF